MFRHEVMGFMVDVFLLNGLVEGSAAVISLIHPNAIPIFKNVKGAGKEAVQWWAAAILALAVASYFIARVPDHNEAKQAFAAGMTVYHILLSVFCAQQYPGQMAAGSIVHVAFTAAFVMYLQEQNYFGWN
eukprot:CAMPEP_0201515322 /NCGR_PEP_ID=MMETSP0161_2-20130828/6924_1 /ASSEMBLY_ACC=CAM_ASM_000251 /TAXON_ID=180227 /ORGANISM="Neoparamoeba aestuarina, Strain SoJaBio B1-5/56/2" /LENGTH=129 /DNA_ID=CAMNT_0047912119 /DNA_START=89 /DNA_END=478 /DNA_ORIENTATION=+